MKSVKISDDSWKSVKMFAAEHDWNIQGFIEFAIREKLQRELTTITPKGENKNE